MNTPPEIELTLEFLWELLSPEEQMEAARCFWSGDSAFQPDIASQIITHIARIRNFREKFVRERPLDWKATELCKRLHAPPLSIYIDDVIREYLFQKKKEMVCAILDAEGTPHDEQGWPSEGATPPTADTFVRGLNTVKGRFADLDLLLYYGIHVFAGSTDHWGALEQAIERPEFDALGKAVIAQRNTQSGQSSKEITCAHETLKVSEPNEEFTTLDHILIKTVIAGATGTEGALPEDALEDVIQEVLTLSSDRHRSYFHLGYLDAVFKKDFRGEFPGGNAARRGWYLTGFLMGNMRSIEVHKVFKIIKEHQRLWDELMENGPASARTMLLPALLPRCAEAGEWRLLGRLFERARLPNDQKRAMDISRSVYDAAADLVRRGSSAEAVPLLDGLQKHLEKTPSLPHEFRNHLNAAARRKIGQDHLRSGRFREAKHLFCEALKEIDFPESANTRTDLGLAKAGFRSLDFLLPKDDERANATVLKALEQHVEDFNSALTNQGRPTNAHFVLGLIDFYRGRSNPAEQHLSNSLTGMLQKQEAYQTAHLVDWTRFLLAVIIAEQCEPARLNEIRTQIEHAMSSPAFFPLHLWARLCKSLTLYDDQSLVESVIQHLLTKRGDPAYLLLKETGLLTKNAALRSSYRQWLDTQQHSPTKKASELESLLKVAFKNGSSDEITEILDALEGVAKSDADCVPGFLSLLKEYRSDILAIWDEVDIDITEAALLERTGRFEECSTVLQRLFYRYRAEGDWTAIEDVLDQAEHLRIPECDVARLRSQVEHLRPPIVSEPVDGALRQRVNVLYVGGNETQARYEEALRNDLKAKHPELNVKFYYPGWTSNWNVHLDALLRLLPQHDVVVINNFVRTQLGRKLRAACGSKVPWRACTGHGRKSLLNAIEVAAHWVSEIQNGNGVRL